MFHTELLEYGKVGCTVRAPFSFDKNDKLIFLPNARTVHSKILKNEVGRVNLRDHRLALWLIALRVYISVNIVYESWIITSWGQTQ